MDEQSISHTRWKCQYHIVFIPDGTITTQPYFNDLLIPVALK